MGRPWKRIALDFVVGITALVAARQLRRLEDDSDDGDDDRSIRLDPGWVLAGAISSVGWTYAYDVDAFGLRESAKRRVALTACWSAVSRRYLSDDVSRTYSHTVGTGVGTLCYRTWFGLVRPRPGSRDSNGESE
ncbi:hypothetical protein [Halopiger xanaduensis]|uniref:DUF8097 domain-containing protein n=1 Tax=Halopiger xanaduensis (strain DSM 18323 / JCM 14033 / SH-6) TaxID=797210 RepID=F8DBS8_HALXS|nr:hypothetical protein [Halopiger xanaduensis]AEH38680.1 hypothetical protein Halxa_4075 [Halopiger xanaduensis SH-6]